MIKDVNFNKAGFCFIELIITIFILSILALVSIPSNNYQEIKRQRLEARQMLHAIAQAIDKQLSKNINYLEINVDNLMTQAAAKNYIYKIVPNSDNYTITATRTNIEQDLECQSFTLSKNGGKFAAGSKPNTCWSNY